MVDAFYSPPAQVEETEISSEEIKESFFSTFTEFAIDSAWIEEKISKDSVYSYLVKVPEDLPLLLVINDLTKNYKMKSVETSSEEEKINGTSTFKVLVKEKVKLSAKLIHSSKSVREESKVSFIIEDVEGLSERNLKRLLDFGYPFAVTLVPSIENENFKNKILESGKEYVVLLNDEINDEKYMMKEGYAKKKISVAISNMLRSFSEAKMFFVDENSDLYESAIFNFVEDEFKKRNIRLYKKSEFKSLNGISAEETESLFDFYKFQKDIPKLFFVKSQNFLLLHENLVTFKKRGNKIIFPSNG